MLEFIILLNSMIKSKKIIQNFAHLYRKFGGGLGFNYFKIIES